MTDRRPTERGMVTAETAVALGALVIIMVGLVWIITVVGAQMRCVDAARDGARAASRGESMAAIRAEALQDAPDGATVAIRFRGSRVEVEVAADTRPSWRVLSGLPAITVRGDATMAVEPGVLGDA